VCYASAVYRTMPQPVWGLRPAGLHPAISPPVALGVSVGQTDTEQV
jgi:hypothetical protein